MDQIPAPGPSKLFHVRMVASLLFFLFWDTVATYICLSTLILDKESLKKGTALGGLGGSSILFTAEVSRTSKATVGILLIRCCPFRHSSPSLSLEVLLSLPGTLLI